MLQYALLEAKVNRTLTATLWADLAKYVEDQNPTVWGMQQPDNYLKSNLLLVLSKARTGVGYNALISKVDFVGRQTGKTAAAQREHPTTTPCKWASHHIVLGKNVDWKAAAKDVKRTKDLAEVNIWIDSSDFAKQKDRETDWSYKLNNPGRRYMFLQDGCNRILKIWKKYDDTA